MLGRTSIRRISHAISQRECSLCLQGNVGWDSGFSSKIGRIPTRSGWLDSLHRQSYFLWRKEAAQAILLFKNSLCFLKVLERHFKLSHSSYVHHKHYQYCNLMKFVELESFASSPRATGHTFHQNRKYCMGCFEVSSWILPCIICSFLSHRNVYKRVTKKSYSNIFLDDWLISYVAKTLMT